MKNNLASMCIGWEYSHRVRHCPSIKVLKMGGENVEKHLSSCKYCRSALEYADWGLGEKLLNYIREQRGEPVKTPVQVGDCRGVVSRLTYEQRWVDGRFNNTPSVLVLSEPNVDGMVKVAQLHDVEDLVANGDIVVSPGFIAEAWNIYNLHVTALSTAAYTAVSEHAVQRVLKRSKMRFPDIPQFHPLYSFRCDEVSVGSFFAMAANIQWLREMEAAAGCGPVTFTEP